MKIEINDEELDFLKSILLRANFSESFKLKNGGTDRKLLLIESLRNKLHEAQEKPKPQVHL